MPEEAGRQVRPLSDFPGQPSGGRWLHVLPEQVELEGEDVGGLRVPRRRGRAR